MNNQDNLTTPIFYSQILTSSNNLAGQQSCKDFKQGIELYWIKNGSGKLSVDFVKGKLCENTMFFVLPGQFHRIDAEGELVGKKIIFSAEYLGTSNRSFNATCTLNNLAILGNSGIIRLEEDISEELDQIFEGISWEINNSCNNKNEMLGGMLTLLLSYLPNREGENHVSHSLKNAETVFNKFISIINENFRTEKQLHFYASQLAISSNYLSEIAKKVSGFSARYHIQQRVLLEAKRKAFMTDMRAKEIGFELGFENPYTFSKYFKCLTGTSFSDFRRKQIDHNE